MGIDRGQKVDTKMFNANIKLQNEVKDYKYKLAITNKKIADIKKFCEEINKTYPESKAFASRIMFIITKEEE